VIRTREQRLLEFLEVPRTLEEIVAVWIVYGRPREPAAYYAFGEEAIMGKHLRRLMSDGRVVRCGDRYVRAAGITPRA
jgi:hypothetical protein